MSEPEKRNKPSGRSGYGFSAEDLRRGNQKANAVRRAKRDAARKSALDLQREAIVDQSERVMSPYWKAIDEGDWRAAEALMDRHFGRPTQRTENADVTPEREISREELERLAKRHLRSVHLDDGEERESGVEHA